MSSQAQRNDLIDVFRACSILAVLVFHYTVEGLNFSRDSLWMKGGLGVQVFFCISGLVITMTALRSNGPSDFAARRFFRIYPTFFLACTVTYLVLALHDPTGYNLKVLDYLGSLTFAPDRLGLKYVDGAYWSLFVEALFYGVVALSLAAFRARFWVGVLGLLVFGAIARPLFSKAIGVLLFAPYSGFFLMGMAGWYAIYERDKLASISLSIGAIICLSLDPLMGFHWPAIPAALFMLGLLALGVNTSVGPMAWIGRCSYPLYLIHQSLGLSLLADLLAWGWHPLVALASTIAIAIIIAAAVHRYVEEPLNKHLMKWWRSQRAPAHAIEPKAAELLSD
jgi:peptidoglycan/LPS O-acetylase OafA/YrhL